MKQLIVLMIFACVLLMTAHEAQAFYNPSTGRWLSRDPIGEMGGINLSLFAGNNAIAFWDYLGEDYMGGGGGSKTPMQTYCEAAKKHPDNKWLACACEVSAQINMLIVGLYLPTGNEKQNKMKGKILEWFDCTRDCLVNKFDKFYSVYDGGMSVEESKPTPYWEKACQKCIGNPKARSSKECCEEMVVAEQTGIDDCSQKCGKYPGDPTKVPGFKGDFSSLEDRIKYGKKRCCEKSSEGNKKGSQRASQ